EVPDERGVHTRVPVDHQYPALARLAQDTLEQCVVLEAAHRGDAAGELGAPAQVTELDVAAADALSDLIDEVGGGDESRGIGHAGPPVAGRSAPRYPAGHTRWRPTVRDNGHRDAVRRPRAPGGTTRGQVRTPDPRPPGRRRRAHPEGRRHGRRRDDLVRPD